MATKVLVFESDAAFASELRSELGKLGCFTTVVDDGNVGLQQAATDKPDLILLSIELPRMNGFSVCNKLKKDPNLKEVPLVIMSSESSEETFEQHKKLRTRAEDYVHKPIAFGELLQHVQRFVVIGSPPRDSEEGIVIIDDEIEIGMTDYVAEEEDTMAARPKLASISGHGRGMSQVDADMDAFAESAFGRLTDGPVPAIDLHSPRNGALPFDGGLGRQGGASSPTQGRSPNSGPTGSVAPSGVEATVHEKQRDELARTRDHLAAVERQLDDARGEADRLRAAMRDGQRVTRELEEASLELGRLRAADGAAERLGAELDDARNELEKLRFEAGENERLARELDELRAKLASGAKSGISSREFLELREALNRKDKEILGLKEQLSKKDRETVETHDRALAFERMKADLEERLLSMERQLEETKDKNDSLEADKLLAKKASEDFRTRLEKSRAENETKERQFAELRAKHADELQAKEATLGALRAELDQTLANERAEQARALDQSEERRKLELERARREYDLTLGAAREQFEREKNELLGAQAGELRREHEAKLGMVLSAGQEALERAQSEATQAARESEGRHAAEVAQLRTETERQARAELESLRAEHATQRSAIEARAASELVAANQQAASLDMDLSVMRGELAALRDEKRAATAEADAKIADLEGRLSAAEAQREELRSSRTAVAAEADAKIADLEGRLSAAEAQREELRSSRTAVAAEADAKIADLEGRLAAVEAQREELRSTGAEAADRVSTLEEELARVRADLATTSEKLLAESSRAERAHAKRSADRQSLERAKDALAIALSQIEEAEGPPAT